jgi:hypothetical protein
MRPSPNCSSFTTGSTGPERRVVGISALNDAIPFHEYRTTVLQHGVVEKGSDA